MQNITLNFTGCKYLSEIHLIMKKEFDFPDYYGENLDALWDCLNYRYDEKTKVIVKGVETLPKELKEYMEKVFDVFRDVHDCEPHVTFEAL